MFYLHFDLFQHLFGYLLSVMCSTCTSHDREMIDQIKDRRVAFEPLFSQLVLIKTYEITIFAPKTQSQNLNATFCAISQQCGDAITHIFYRPAEIWLNLIFTLVLWAICYLYGVNRKSIEERGRRGIPSADGSPGAPHIKSESWDTEAAKPGKMTSHTVLSVAQILLAFRMKGTFQLFCFDCHSKLEYDLAKEKPLA